jgi:hypothetical protein
MCKMVRFPHEGAKSCAMYWHSENDIVDGDCATFYNVRSPEKDLCFLAGAFADNSKNNEKVMRMRRVLSNESAPGPSAKRIRSVSVTMRVGRVASGSKSRSKK